MTPSIIMCSSTSMYMGRLDNTKHFTTLAIEIFGAKIILLIWSKDYIAQKAIDWLITG